MDNGLSKPLSAHRAGHDDALWRASSKSICITAGPWKLSRMWMPGGWLTIKRFWIGLEGCSDSGPAEAKDRAPAGRILQLGLIAFGARI